MKTFDYLVVGSGCSGAMSAQTLVEAGVQVAMLDVGEQDPKAYARAIPDKPFLDIRRDEQDQYRYLVGEDAEGIAWTDIGKGAQVTPPRQHMLAQVERLMPLKSSTFSPVESLGYGGLGIGWGLQCWEYSEPDARAAGLDPGQLYPAYEVVSSRIGVSATKDDASRYTMGRLEKHQPSPKLDRNHRYIYDKYAARKQRFNDQGFYLSRTPLALITKSLNGRRPYDYKDMDFYSDNDQSAWRPWITVNALKKKKNFTYVGGYLLLSFKEEGDFVELSCLEVKSNEAVRFRCRKLILATGTLSSARIVLRSLGDEQTRLPLLCNPYTYIPCLQPAMTGKGVEHKKLGFAQLSVFYDQAGNDFDASVASLYSYQSLMMFRTIRQVPFNFVDARALLNYLLPGIVIMGVHHADARSEHKYVRLTPDKRTVSGDKLTAVYNLDEADRQKYDQRERAFIKALRSMGTFALKRVDPGFGASIHYAGTLPFSQTDTPFTLNPNGRLHGTRRVYVADSSGLTYLPAKGLTFSLMANAHIITEGVLRDA